ncbi:MAG TPA: rhomboid family intramembrane serine protease [Bryobacteraceae bacterium]|nr:rhomboid family intramembrane serine protease [Bryobacteraceae bacterium]
MITIILIAINLFTLLYENALPEYAQRAFVWRYALIPDQFHQYALITSMFLHGGWFHLIGNMWFLWVFGSHLEEALGAARFLAFYLISGVASAAVQLFVSLGSSVPTVGASGAIAGVMGAFLFLYPRARVITLIFFIFITTVELPAAFMLLYWFAIQLLSGLGSLTVRTQGQGIAWFAHVGGFLAGLLFVRLFADRRLRPRY